MTTEEAMGEVRRLEITTRHLVRDILAGQSLSVFRGRAVEFSEVGEYPPGDDVRRKRYDSSEGESAKELTESQARRLLEAVQREQLQTHEGRRGQWSGAGGKDWQVYKEAMIGDGPQKGAGMPVEHRTFGKTGIVVPVVGMGTWLTFDVHRERDVEDRRTVVDTALAAGTTLFDTSPMYGTAEAVLARLLSGRRDRALVADKVWTPSAREGREQVRRALEWYSGVVDIYQVHNLVAWREHLPMLEECQARAQVRVIGATHYQHSAFGALMAIMRTGRIQMVQIPYNAADQVVEREVLPLAAELGLGVLVMQPLGTGTLVRRAPSARELAPLDRFGVRTWAQALLKWILSDPRVHAVLPATRRAARAAENAQGGVPPWFDNETRDYVARLATRQGR